MALVFTAILVGMVLLAAPLRADGLEGCGSHIKYGAPGRDGVLLCRLGYALSHNSSRKVADWVAYRLTREKMAGTHPRSNNFRADPDLDAGKRSEKKDYKGSGFDRGHMAPAAAMKWDARAMSESFLLSNMAPQVGPGFNRGIWRSLESRVRDWTRARGELDVVTGPIYLANADSTIGSNQVAVPTHFYKAIFDPTRVEGIAFILPNKKLKTKDLPTFIRSIDDIEDQTGLDFLAELEDTVEAIVEANIQPKMWPRP